MKETRARDPGGTPLVGHQRYWMHLPRERQLRIGGRIGRSFKDDERLLAMSSGKATERRVIQGTNHGIVVVVEFPVE